MIRRGGDADNAAELKMAPFRTAGHKPGVERPSAPTHPGTRVPGDAAENNPPNPFLRPSGRQEKRNHPQPPAPPTAPLAEPAATHTTEPPPRVASKVLPKGFRSSDAAAVARWCVDPALPGLRATVFSVGGGVGVSTVTAAIGGFVAALSTDPVVALELADRPWAGLSRRVAGEPQSLSVVQWRQDPAVSADPVAALKLAAAGPSGLRVLGAAADQLPWWWATIPAPVAVFLDAGSFDSNPQLPGLLAQGGPVAVMVARADGSGVDAALTALAVLKSAVHGRPPEVLVVLVDAGGYGRVAVKAAAQLVGSVAQVVTVGQSEALRRNPLRIDQLEKPTAAAIARIAHHIADRTWRRGAATASNADLAPSGGAATVHPAQPFTPSSSLQEETA